MCTDSVKNSISQQAKQTCKTFSESEYSVNLKGFDLQVEQVSKYTVSKPRRPLADCWISRRLLHARGWTLICISEHEWTRLRDFDVKLAFIEGKIKEITQSQIAVEANEKEAIRQIA